MIATISFKDYQGTIEVHDLIMGLPEYVSTEIATNQTYFEPEVLEYWYKEYGHVKHFVDIGAHIGNHSHFMKHVLGVKTITAFEPLPQNFEVLNRNLPDAALHNVAVGNTETEVDLQTGGMPGKWVNTGYTHVVKGTGTKQITLDSLNLKDVDLIKIDVEDAEVGVIEGALNTLKRCKPIIFMEINEMKNFSKVYSLLSPIGYHLHHVLNDGNVNVEWRV